MHPFKYSRTLPVGEGVVTTVVVVVESSVVVTYSVVVVWSVVVER